MTQVVKHTHPGKKEIFKGVYEIEFMQTESAGVRESKGEDQRSNVQRREIPQPLGDAI